MHAPLRLAAPLLVLALSACGDGAIFAGSSMPPPGTYRFTWQDFDPGVSTRWSDGFRLDYAGPKRDLEFVRIERLGEEPPVETSILTVPFRGARIVEHETHTSSELAPYGEYTRLLFEVALLDLSEEVEGDVNALLEVHVRVPGVESTWQSHHEGLHLAAFDAEGSHGGTVQRTYTDRERADTEGMLLTEISRSFEDPADGPPMKSSIELRWKNP